MKQLNKAVLLCLTLSALPAVAVAAPRTEHIRNRSKATLFGGLSAGSLFLAYKAFNPYVSDIGNKFVGMARKTGSMPGKHAMGECALGLTVMGVLAYSTYYFGKKCAQELGWFKPKPVEEESTD